MGFTVLGSHRIDCDISAVDGSHQCAHTVTIHSHDEADCFTQLRAVGWMVVIRTQGRSARTYCPACRLRVPPVDQL